MDESQLELCQVVLKFLGMGHPFSPIVPGRYQFEAWATGSNGRYRAATSPEFETSADIATAADKTAADALQELADQLVRDGWQPWGQASDWYAHQFHRQMS